MERPILVITIGFITGNILGLYLDIAPFVFLVLILFMIFIKLIDYKNNNSYIRILKIFIKNNIIMILLVTAVISSTYIVFCNMKFKKFYKEFSNTEIIATVISNNKETEYKNTYKVKIENLKGYKNNIKLILRISKAKKISLNYGDKIKIIGKYSVPEEARNYGGFNYREYLKTQKVYGIFEADIVEILKQNNLSFIELFTNKVKLKIIENFNNILSEENSQLFLGILIGYDDNLSEDIEESFRKSSLTHLLAVSGAHIVYIIVGVGFVLNKLKITKRTTQIITILFLILFMYITDFSSSVVRASIMGIILLLAFVLSRRNDIKTTISISILLILLENPYKILDIGLLLSYFATIGIICFSKLKKENKVDLNLKEKFIEYIKEMIFITIFANIFVIPIMIYNFNTISLTFIISNLIAGILIGPITIGGFILIIISFISVKLTYIMAVIYNLLLELLIFSTKLTSLIPLSEILVSTPNIIILIIYYMILFLCITYVFVKKEYSNRYIVKKISQYILKVYKYVKNSYKIILAYITICLILIILILKIIPMNLKIYFIDVGQGDSTLIITPTNKKILIDSGGSESGNYDVGKNTLVPYLLDRKIICLDYICISHFDSDHCDGFKYLLKNIKVKSIVLSNQYEKTDNFEEIISIVNEKKINVIEVEEGEVLDIDKYIRFKIFSPGKELKEDINDNSIVMKLEYNNFSCLFTGDISKQIEQDLVKKYKDKLKSTVLKVAHHGSKTSSDENFIKAVSPKISLIGVGKNNKFGHPNEEVLQILKSINSTMFRTDKDGEIVFKINMKRNYKNKHIFKVSCIKQSSLVNNTKRRKGLIYLKKTIIILICLFIIAALGTYLGVVLYNQDEENLSNELNNTVIMPENKIENSTIETSSVDEEKTTPNTLIIYKTYYTKCNHFVQEYKQIDASLVNYTEKELKEKSKNWDVDKFSAEEIEMTREKETFCGEHYKIKLENSTIVIYSIEEDGIEKEYEHTGITTEYLTEEDILKLTSGIYIYGKENLTSAIEDYE